jgi:exodeoxyribonuclease-3
LRRIKSGTQFESRERAIFAFLGETMGKQEIRLASWNVNGLRAVVKKGFFESLQHLDVDILGLQETKLQGHQLTDEMKDVAGYQSFWSHATAKKGYSGVGVYTRREPKSVREGLGIPEIDNEGRILELEFDEFTFFNVYFPNGQMNEERLRYKLDFYEALFRHTNSLRDRGKHIVIAGDYNTAHNEIDLKNPKANEKTSGFLRIERDWLDRIVAEGYIDTFRHFYPETVKYSWWTYRFKARERNVGWRIDYLFVTEEMIKNGIAKEAWIDNDIHGSDHCPVGVVLQI